MEAKQRQLEGMNLKVEGQREKMEAVMLSRSRDCIAESLAGEKAQGSPASAPPPQPPARRLICIKSWVSAKFRPNQWVVNWVYSSNGKHLWMLAPLELPAGG